MKEWLVLPIIAIVMIAVICVPLALFMPRASTCADLNFTYKIQTIDATYYANNLTNLAYSTITHYIYSDWIVLDTYCQYGKVYNTTINIKPYYIEQLREQ